MVAQWIEQLAFSRWSLVRIQPVPVGINNGPLAQLVRATDSYCIVTVLTIAYGGTDY